LRAQPTAWSANAVRKNHGFDHRFSEDEFIRYTFDLTPDAANAITVDDFNFDDDIKIASIDQPGLSNLHTGRIARIPDRFKPFIDGGLDTVGRQKNPADGRTRAAKRSLRLLAFMEACRNVVRQFKDR
jgi:hypothetical protein